MASGRRIAGDIKSLVNARSLQLVCARVLHESLIMPLLTYGSATMIWMEKERSRIRAVQIDDLRVLLGIRRMDEVPNARVRHLCVVTKDVDENIDESVLRWFDHVERKENDTIAKRVYVGECAGSRSVDRTRKRCVDTVKDCLKKRGLDVSRAKRMVHDRSVWQGFVRGNTLGVTRVMNS